MLFSRMKTRMKTCSLSYNRFIRIFLNSPDNGCDSRLFSGDQLTVERAVNIISSVPDGYTPKDRLDRITLQLGDWHAGVKILSVSRVQSIEIKYCLHLYMEAKPQ